MSEEPLICACSLCRERAGQPVEKMVIVYEQPKVRARGEPCDCRHCTALRAEQAIK